MGITLTMEATLALFRKTRPALAYLRLHVFRFSSAALNEGIEFHILDAISVLVYALAKFVVDSFKYRSKVVARILKKTEQQFGTAVSRTATDTGH